MPLLGQMPIRLPKYFETGQPNAVLACTQAILTTRFVPESTVEYSRVTIYDVLGKDLPKWSPCQEYCVDGVLRCTINEIR